MSFPLFSRCQTPRAACGRWTVLATATALCLSATGCSSLFSEGAATGAAVGGAAIASKVTSNATVASGIGLGVLAAAQAGVDYVEKRYHNRQQDRIAAAAGPLDVGATASWESRHAIELEPDAKGKVTVNRIISAGELNCKEIVFSIETMEDKAPQSNFFVATICRDATQWKWASAEPATARWGSLQ